MSIAEDRLPAGFRLETVACPQCGQTVPVQVGNLTGPEGTSSLDDLITQARRLARRSCPGPEFGHPAVRVGEFPPWRTAQPETVPPSPAGEGQ